MSLLNLYPAIPLLPLSSVAVASVVLASTFIVFVVAVAVGVNAVGASVSIFSMFPVAYPFDCPVLSIALAYIAWFLVSVIASV